MKFIEYVELRNPAISNWIEQNSFKSTNTRKQILFDLISNNQNKLLTEFELYLNGLNNLLIDYAITGGVIKAIDAYLGTGKIPTSLYNEYKEYLLGETLKARKREDYLRETLTQVFETHTTPVGWETLKSRTSIRSRGTVSSYINLIQNCYLISVINKQRGQKGIPDYVKDKKIYFSDPFVFHSLHGWIYGLGNPYASTIDYVKDNEKLSLLLESIICSHILRLIYTLYESPLIDPKSHLFFWRGKKDKEVDFVFDLERVTFPVEVKYRNQLRTEDKLGMLNYLDQNKVQRGIILSKNIIDYSDPRYTILPISIFLSLI